MKKIVRYTVLNEDDFEIDIKNILFIHQKEIPTDEVNSESALDIWCIES